MRLDDTKVTAHWLDSAAVSRAAGRAHRRRFGLATVAAAVLAAAIVVPLTVPGSSPRPVAGPGATSPAGAPAPVTGDGVRVAARLAGGVQLMAADRPTSAPDPTAIDPLATAEQQFTLALLDQLGAGGTADGGNMAVSPASLAIALAMLQNGAKGATLTQMQAALRASGLTTEQQNAGWQALLASWAEDAKADGISFNAANAYFGQVGAPVNPAFLSTLGQYYDAGVWQVDFADQLKAAADTINAWADQQTNGKIKKLFDARDLDPQTLAVLANAVYFKAAWADPFVTDNSAPADFHTPSGITRPTFMNSTGTTATGVITPDYQAAQLPYTGDRFAATIIMPTTESLSSFVSALTPADLAKITSALDPATTGASQAVLSLPRFTTTSDLTLNQALIDLGMPDAFGPAADFTAMSPLASHISLVKQMVYLSVTEQGTEAAAVTGIAVAGMGAMAPPLVITVDHPFLFLIRDTQTGAILFAAEITDPQD